MTKLWIVFVAVIAALEARTTGNGNGRPGDDSWRIVGGGQATKGAYPWQVSLRARGPNGQLRHICGGSIVASQWVLTASHCVQPDPNPSSYVVAVGEHDFTVEEGTEQYFNVYQVIMNEYYDPERYNNDVTLLLLDREMSFNQFVAPIPMATPNQNNFNGQESCATSGWGDLYFHGYPPTILQEVSMPLVPHQQCEQAYQDVNQVTDVMICAGYMQGGQGVCQGDSGGPLVCQLNGQWTLVGVTSWGVGCAEQGRPGIFARVSAFYNWANQHMQSFG